MNSFIFYFSFEIALAARMSARENQPKLKIILHLHPLQKPLNLSWLNAFVLLVNGDETEKGQSAE